MSRADAAGRYTVAQYFDLVRQGVLQPDDRVELLEGVIVVMYWIVSRRDGPLRSSGIPTR